MDIISEMNPDSTLEIKDQMIQKLIQHTGILY